MLTRDDVRARLKEVRRTEATCTYIWDAQPLPGERFKAERDNPPRRHLVGHSWPGRWEQHAPGAWKAVRQ